MYRHEDAAGERTLTIRPQSDRDDRNREVDRWRYDQEYREYDSVRSPYSPSRDDEYQIVHRSEALGDRRLSRRERDYDYYDEERSIYRREISPHSSASHYRDRRYRDYTSDDELALVNRASRGYREESPHFKRHLAEGALVGIGTAEAIRFFQKKRGESPSDGLSRFSKDLGGGALGAVAGGMLSRAKSRHRSKSRRRAESLDRRSHRHHHHHRRRHRSRSSSRSRAKTLTSLGLAAVGATALAVGLARKSQKESEKESPSRRSSRSRQSRSRHRRSSSSSESDGPRARSTSRRNKKIAKAGLEAGLAGAVTAGLIQKARSKSRSRRGERSRSQIGKAFPVVAAALGSAGIAAFREGTKAKKDEEKAEKRPRRRSRSRSRSMSRTRSRSKTRSATATFPDTPRSETRMIEYGDDPVHSGLDEYYPRSASQERYQAIEAGYGRRQSRERKNHRDQSNSGTSSSASERQSKGRRRHRKKSRSRSRSKEFATASTAATAAATGAGLAAREYGNRDRRRADKERQKYDKDDPYEEGYNPAYMSSSPPPSGAPYQQGPYFPQPNVFPPPPATAGNPPAPYNSAGYPPPPGALPQTQPYQYPPSPAAAPNPYAPRPFQGEENA